MTSCGLAPCVLIAATLLAGTSPRQELSLNGVWEHQIAEQADAPPVAGPWTPCDVPGYLRSVDYQRAWFRRSFTVPAEMRGQRLKIRFGGVKYNSRVFVNGKHVGGSFGGYRPFEVDVTGAVRPEGPNELAVGCHDWTGIFTPGKVDFSETAEWHRRRDVPHDKILAPIGGLFDLYGIWDDVTLRSHPAVCVEDLFIKPSVQRGELVVVYTLRNESAADAEVELRAAVEDGTDDVLELPPARARVPAGETITLTVRQPWEKPHLWSHVDPYLYHLRTELSTGDLLRTRFGFREFRVEGHNFYLNGVKVNLLATSWWPPHAPMTREEIRERWEAVKRCGCVAFRTHTQPWRSVHYEVADEVGLLMIIEGAVWNDDYVYRIDDPVFWENYARHLEAMVRRDKNRPSVVMWSLENEFYGGRLNDKSPAKEDLVRMGKLVKQWDPTRPMFYESDGDPGGVADCVSIHYPHEYPDYTCWPNEADWLARPQRIGHMFHNGRDEFFWRKGKPLYVGEFLWIPSRDPSWHTVFFGDEAYTDYRRYRNLAKAESWKMQILGYRRHEVAGISPWTVIEGGPLDETNPLYRAHQFAYQPIAAYCLDYDRRFFAGEKVTRRVEVFNDVMEPSDLTLSSTLTERDDVIDAQQQALRLGPGEHRTLEVSLPLDKVRPAPGTAASEVQWHLALVRNEATVFEADHDYKVFPRHPKPADAAGPSSQLRTAEAEIGLFDPTGSTKKALEDLHVPTTPVGSLADLGDAFDVLVIGAGTLEAGEGGTPVVGRVAPERKSLMDFVRRGGRVLVLEQEAYPTGLFDVELSEHASTMTFPVPWNAPAPESVHPAIRHVSPADLAFWRGDHMVSKRELPRPLAGAARPIVVSGSRAGLEYTPLLERPTGRGSIVHAQLRLVEKCSSEPAAMQILDDLLAYLVDYEPAARKTAVIGGDDAYHAYLRSLGLRFDVLPADVPAEVPAAALSGYSLVLCRGELGDAPAIRTCLEQGVNVLVHRATADTLRKLGPACGLDLACQEYPGCVSRADSDHPLQAAVLCEDLYWLGEHKGIGWATTPRAKNMVDGIFTKTLDGKDAIAYEVEDWKLEGGIVERREPGVTFATVGSASAEIDFPVAGRYVIGVLARGTPCLGEYPLVRVSVDGEPLGTIPVGGSRWETAATFGDVEQGRHLVSVAFINDGSDPPTEDRNLYVDRVLIARDENPGAVAFLTSPPAVAAVPCGKGTLLIDQVCWDTEEQNARKAARFACSLLTALGGDFTPRLGVAVECERMTPQEGIPHFHNYGDHVALACTGYVKGPIEVAASGRYEVEVVAAGSKAAEVYPLVEVRIDGEAVGQVQLTGGSWRPYPLDVELTSGPHELALVFTNDYNRDGEDRNLMLDKVVFYRE